MAGLRIKPRLLAAVLGVGTVVGAAGLAGCGSSDLDERGQLLRTTAEYLWTQQGEDGGWHSETHGLLRGGETWTPFVAHYLFQIPDSIFLCSRQSAGARAAVHPGARDRCGHSGNQRSYGS